MVSKLLLISNQCRYVPYTRTAYVPACVFVMNTGVGFEGTHIVAFAVITHLRQLIGTLADNFNQPTGNFLITYVRSISSVTFYLHLNSLNGLRLNFFSWDFQFPFRTSLLNGTEIQEVGITQSDRCKAGCQGWYTEKSGMTDRDGKLFRLPH